MYVGSSCTHVSQDSVINPGRMLNKQRVRITAEEHSVQGIHYFHCSQLASLCFFQGGAGRIPQLSTLKRKSEKQASNQGLQFGIPGRRVRAQTPKEYCLFKHIDMQMIFIHSFIHSLFLLFNLFCFSAWHLSNVAACHSPQVTRSKKVDFALFTLISLELCLVTFVL